MPSCQGGFCSLVLPHENDTNNKQGYTSVLKKQQSHSSSKGERRLRRSRQRQRAILHLQWVLTDEEYSTLEESGDLVTLRVNDREDENDECWVDEASIILAKREHRPELARLAFAEFRSSTLGDAGNNCCGLDGDCAAGGGGYANACTILEPGSADKKGYVTVCSNCYNVYDSLKQARALLNRQERNDLEEERDASETFDIGKNEQPAPKNGLVCQNEKDEMDEECPIQVSSSSNPSRVEDDNNHSKPAKKKKKKRSKRRRRNKKQLEENSKVRILVAESDEVRFLSTNVHYM